MFSPIIFRNMNDSDVCCSNSENMVKSDWKICPDIVSYVCKVCNKFWLTRDGKLTTDADCQNCSHYDGKGNHIAKGCIRTKIIKCTYEINIDGALLYATYEYNNKGRYMLITINDKDGSKVAYSEKYPNNFIIHLDKDYIISNRDSTIWVEENKW